MANGKNKDSYFSHFGFRHICDLTLLSAAIVLIVGMFVEPVAVRITGFALFIAGAVMSIVRMITIFAHGINKSSPEFKNAVVNTVIMTIVLGLSVFGLVYTALFMTV